MPETRNTASEDLQFQLDNASMSRVQWLAISLAIFLNALDGYDAASISFAAPGMSDEWSLPADTLGWVLSMELIGMALGSLLFGGWADKYGRRPTILGCLTIMAIGKTGAVFAGNVLQLSILRVITGLGIGGMVAALTALVSEHSNARRRSLVLAVMLAGYPLGLVLGGVVARNLLLVAHWRSVFVFGAVMTVVALPLVWKAVPESIPWLVRKRPVRALDRVNSVLAKFGHQPVSHLAVQTEEARKGSPLLAILSPPLASITLLLTAAYLTHVSCFYFIVKWIPTLVVDMGFSASNGADVLVWTMIGASASGPLFAYAAGALSVRSATIIALVASVIVTNTFARVGPDLILLISSGILFGVFTLIANIGFYSLLASSFPPDLRATGTGFGIGVGRAGAAFGPALGGTLFAGGLNLPEVALIMSFGSLLSIVCILFLKRASTI